MRPLDLIEDDLDLDCFGHDLPDRLSEADVAALEVLVGNHAAFLDFAGGGE